MGVLGALHAGSVALFWILAAIIDTCYGGGFGTMPSTAGKFFGVTHAGGIYGLTLIAWSIGGVVGPLLVSALASSDNNWPSPSSASSPSSAPPSRLSPSSPPSPR
ncbi:MAG: hypothetical protein LCH82_00125 [Actinobacteria bacterium]|nr:hypothetical protein [Actinomycetota bacterium]